MLSVSSAIKVRLFSGDDLNAILEIQKACGCAPAWGRHDYGQLADDSRGMILVAELEVGVLPKILAFAAFFRVDEEAELWSIAVAPQYQQRGIARLLLLEGCRRLCDAGARRLFLEVRGSNTPAMGLYQGLGFVLLTSRKDYYQNPTEDALILVRELIPFKV